jgi:hypothetical protein
LLPENPSGPDSSTMRPDIPSKHLAARPGWSWRRDTRHDGPDGAVAVNPEDFGTVLAATDVSTPISRMSTAGRVAASARPTWSSVGVPQRNW